MMDFGQFNRDLDEILEFAERSPLFAQAFCLVRDAAAVVGVIDDSATKRANDGRVIYKLPDSYLRLLAAARTGQFNALASPLVGHVAPSLATTPGA